MSSKERELVMEQRKEDIRLNNSKTPASFRIESGPKLDPHIQHMTHHSW